LPDYRFNGVEYRAVDNKDSGVSVIKKAVCGVKLVQGMGGFQIDDTGFGERKRERMNVKGRRHSLFVHKKLLGIILVTDMFTFW
jgi:hypothetical protein